jgi:hypothetical protein
MNIEQAIYDLHALGRRDAEWLGDQIVDRVIEALQRDPVVPARHSLDWMIALANVRQRIVQHLSIIVDDNIDRSDVFNALRDHGLLDTEYEP